VVLGTGVKAYDEGRRVEPLSAGCRFTFEEQVELPYGAQAEVQVGGPGGYQ
jgi:hypothetical protein